MTAKLDPRWTIAELGARVEAALAGAAAEQKSDRVRAVPDLRTIRYYTTLGLIDRPAAMRGRTALYGLRHLLQLVAIKRLQAEGRSLAEVQAALTGLTQRELRRVAAIAERDLAALASAEPESGVEAEPGPRREAFWTEIPADPAPPKRGELIGLTLTAGASLLLDAMRPLTEEDRRALRAAAAPILRELETRGLVRASEQETERNDR